MRRCTPALWTFVALGSLAVALGLAAGATSSELGSFEDEPAHVATALMLRDWVTTWPPAHPIRFAELYYVHFPKVAIGQWPPMYHAWLALWMLVVGASTTAVTLANATLAAAAAWLAARFVARDGRAGSGAESAPRREATPPEPDSAPMALVGFVAGGVMLALPLVRELQAAAMTEVALACVGIAAALAFARWIERPCVGRAAWFGALAVAAIMTKGPGLALALVPPLALLLARRPRLALKPSLYVAPIVVAVLCAPWYALALPLSRSTWAEGGSPSLEYALRALRYYPGEVVRLGGPTLVALAAVGLWSGLAARTSRTRTASLAAWLLALAILDGAIPSSLEARHLVIGAPAFAALAGLGAVRTVRWLVRRGAVRLALARPAAVAAALLLLAPAWPTFARATKKDWQGFDEAARAVLGDPTLAGASVLVASGSTGEGLGVLGFALQESPRLPRGTEGTRPARQVLRASKVLASAGWTGSDYRTLFGSPEELADWLSQVPVAVVLRDRSTPERHRREHLEQLDRALESEPTPWQLRARIDVVRAGVRHPGALELWVAPELARTRPRTLTLDEVLGRARPGVVWDGQAGGPPPQR
jgi:hypothetical protein